MFRLRSENLKSLLSLVAGLVLLFNSYLSLAQPDKKSADFTAVKRPSLVVGLVVDQMRYDYLYRYSKGYTEYGFKRLLKQGFSCENAHFDYVPTYTAPGHACVYTGTTPAINGIISNEWYDRSIKKSVYCVNDTTVEPVGTTSISGKMSPVRLLSTTITDELRFATNYRSKVIAIALKDRGAILPGGHTANAAYWHDPYLDNWVTSTYYRKELPVWAQQFNARKLPDSLTSQPWNLLLKPNEYTGSTADDSPYEGPFKGESKPVFPHDLPKLKSTDGELIRRSPMGNTYTLEFAKAAITGEELGKHEDTDFLAVSLSSPDYIGHQFGINALETEDNYLRLDRELAAFIDYLDAKIGRSNYVLFLTADHGACANPEFNADHHVPGGTIDEQPMRDSIKAMLVRQFGDSQILLEADASGIFLDRELMQRKKVDASKVEEACVQTVLRFKGVAGAWTASELSRSITREGIARLVQRGYNPQRSADVCIQLQPGWIDWFRKTGTTHGSSYAYDTHVPVIFFGGDIKHGETHQPVSICDIAPTLAAMLRIQEPSGCVGKPIIPVLKD